MLGHNGRIAWGMTTTGADTFDLFIERLVDNDPTRYQTVQGPKPFEVRTHDIAIKNETERLRIIVRRTHHGVVLADLTNDAAEATAPGEALVLASTMFHGANTTADALFRINAAANVEQFVKAANDWSAPVQNLFVADSDGRVALAMAGWIPDRKLGDGWTPQPGWNGEYDWRGIIAADRLPRAIDPESGFLMNANNRLTGEVPDVFISRDWDAPFRALRLQEGLADATGQDLLNARRWQLDHVSVFARHFMAKIVSWNPGDHIVRFHLAALREWDGEMLRSRAEPLVFNAWMRALRRQALDALLKEDAASLAAGGREFPYLLLEIASNEGTLCEKIDCRAVLEQSLRSAADALTQRYGQSRDGWRWGQHAYRRVREPGLEPRALCQEHHALRHQQRRRQLYGQSRQRGTARDADRVSACAWREPACALRSRQSRSCAVHHHAGTVRASALAALGRSRRAMGEWPLRVDRRDARCARRRRAHLHPRAALNGMAGPMSPEPGLDDIRQAAATLTALDILRTPSIPAGRLSALLGATLTLKLENLQRTGSFKVRGAGVRLAALTPTERARGVIAMSAGNHAQGVAYHAQRMGVPATIVMPSGTPFTKIERTRALGATVIIAGATLSEAAQHADERAKQGRLVFIHPYDDKLIVAGQGTVALELLADAAKLDMLVVPIGGGGLMAGCAIAARALAPELTIIGVQSALYPAMKRALAGDDSAIAAGPSLAEGIAVKLPGELTRRIIARTVDDILLVEESAIEQAVNLLIVEEKLLAEGAGAAGIAAVLAHRDRFAGKRVGIVICGGNIDARVTASILMRGLASSGRLARLRIEIPDAPGMLARVATAIAGAGGNIVEIVHQRMFHDVPVTRADVDVVLETRGADHLDAIKAALREAGLGVAELAQGSSAELQARDR